MALPRAYALPFYKYSPSGNVTILVPDAEVPKSERALLACRLMDRQHLCAEQVGYVDTKFGRVDMMGGELCVNACRATAALLHTKGRLPGTDFSDAFRPPDDTPGWTYGEIESSGVDGKLIVRVRPEGEHSYQAGVCLRLGKRPAAEKAGTDTHIFRLPGIVHIVIEGKIPEHWREASAALRERFSLLDEEAVGCLWLDIQRREMTPVVWVRDTGLEHLETACGSGTLACALHMLENEGTAHIHQPGGEILSASLVLDAAGRWNAWIQGSVTCIASGETYVEWTEQHA